MCLCLIDRLFVYTVIRYFQKSIQKNKDRPMCPYGKDCFYQHLKEDGTPYIFKDGVDVCMRVCRAFSFILDYTEVDPF